MAYQIQGNVIISNSRELLGVSTAGISTVYAEKDVFVTETLDLAGSITFDGGTTTYNNVVTDLSGAGANDLASAESIKTYVDTNVGAGNTMEFTGNTGNTGAIDLVTETFSIVGDANEIVTDVAAVDGNQITIGLSDTLVAPGTLQVTGLSTFVANVELQGNLTGDGATNILGINSVTATEFYGDGSNLTGVIGSGGDGSISGNLTVESLTVTAGPSNITGALNALSGLDVTGHSELETLRVSGLSTFQSAVQMDSTLNVTGNATFDGSISFVGGDADENFTGITTSLTESAGATEAVTAAGVKNYVDSTVGASNFLSYTDGTTNGRIELGSETFEILGTTNQVVSTVDAAAGLGNTITFSLPSTLIAPGSIQATSTLTVDTTSTLTGHVAANGGVSVTGICTATDFNSTSDIRKKENIVEIDDALAKVESLRGVLFDWKDGSGASGGIIAQEVEAVLPTLVREGEDHKTVIYNGLIGLLINAVKELKSEVDTLKSAQ